MHFLSTQEVDLASFGAACDLKQSAAEIIVMSVADSELAVLSRAQDFLLNENKNSADSQPSSCSDSTPSLRLANLRDLQHPASVDLYIEKTLAYSQVVIARLLGGAEYFPYFCDQVEQACREHKIALAFLAGDGQEDLSLYRRSTISIRDLRLLHRYLLNGGIRNCINFLRAAKCLISSKSSDKTSALRAPLEPVQELPEAGLYVSTQTSGKIVSSNDAPQALLLFYRALVQAGDTEPVDGLISACAKQGITLTAMYVSSLKSKRALLFLQKYLKESPPSVFLNATGFALGEGEDPLARCDCPVLQVAFSSTSYDVWQESSQGLKPTDLAMQVVLPEMDGRIFTRATAFKRRALMQSHTQFSPIRFHSSSDRCDYVARLAAAWLRLRSLENREKHLAIILHNYPYRDGRIANGVGLDTPRSLQTILTTLADAGYDLGNYSDGASNGALESRFDSDLLLARLRSGPTNEDPRRISDSPVRLSASSYARFFHALAPSLREDVERLWGKVSSDFCSDPFFHHASSKDKECGAKTSSGYFSLPIILLGKVAICLQPSRGYDRDPAAIAHDPALAPPHSYLALYYWLERVWRSAAMMHLGKHGTAEWLPGKSLALSNSCACEAVLSALPHLYPFIVSDPGEGTQAKRRGSAVILDHLSPPLSRSMLYGDSAELERLLDEYAEARLLHPQRARVLVGKVAELGERSGLLEECGIDSTDLSRIEDIDDASRAVLLSRLDGHICDLKELQIRNGLHRFGEQQERQERVKSLCALLRLSRGNTAEQESLPCALVKDLSQDALDIFPSEFDPLDQSKYGNAWIGGCPSILASYANKRSGKSFRCWGDVVAALENYSEALVAGEAMPPQHFAATRSVLNCLHTEIAPLFDSCAPQELSSVLRGFSGRFVAPGPSGAPSRGRIEVLPTGRNFFSVDVRALPSVSAWQLGWHSASLLVERYREEHGRYPLRMALSAWGTACMRTAGEDAAQMLALMGVRPIWQAGSGRVDSFEVLPLDVLGRPRVDVTLRISGFFRDAFPRLITLLDRAVQAVGSLQEEREADNPLAASIKSEHALLGDSARYRIFGSAPGSYGTGLNIPLDSGDWQEEQDLAQTYLQQTSSAYSADGVCMDARLALEHRLSSLDAIIHNQDNREHDILDSDDYYQFEGGLALAAYALSGKRPTMYHNDHSRPNAPRISRLEHEIARIVRARAVNPNWIAAMRKHGYKGASEIAATLDYLFAFAATTKLVKDRHFDMLFDAYLADKKTLDFLAQANPSALKDMQLRFQEARERKLWQTRRNDIPALLAQLAQK